MLSGAATPALAYPAGDSMGEPGGRHGETSSDFSFGAKLESFARALRSYVLRPIAKVVGIGTPPASCS